MKSAFRRAGDLKIHHLLSLSDTRFIYHFLWFSDHRTMGKHTRYHYQTFSQSQNVTLLGVCFRWDMKGAFFAFICASEKVCNPAGTQGLDQVLLITHNWDRECFPAAESQESKSRKRYTIFQTKSPNDPYRTSDKFLTKLFSIFHKGSRGSTRGNLQV